LHVVIIQSGTVPQLAMTHQIASGTGAEIGTSAKIYCAEAECFDDWQ